MSENSQPGPEQVVITNVDQIIISVNFEARELIITKATFNPESQANINPSEEVTAGPSAGVDAVPAINQSAQAVSESNIEESSDPSKEVVPGPSANVEEVPETRQPGWNNPASNIDETDLGSNKEEPPAQKSVIFVQNGGSGAVNINIGTYGANTLRTMIVKESKHEEPFELKMSRAVDSSSDTKSSDDYVGITSSDDSSTTSDDPPESASPRDENVESASSTGPNGPPEYIGAREDASHGTSSQEDDRDSNRPQESRDNCSDDCDQIHSNGHGNQRIGVIDDGDSFEVEL